MEFTTFTKSQNKEGENMSRRDKPVIRENSLHHIYQNTRRGHLLFYSTKDYLVCFSTISLAAKRYNVQILGICMMVDHLHLIIRIQDAKQLSSFVHDYVSLFTRRQNHYYRQTGELFNPYGCAPKNGHKRIRSALAYLYNNPVENHLTLKAEEYRWNFLAYSGNKYPFCEKYRMDYIPWKLRKAMYYVKNLRKSKLPLDYALLDNITEGLTAQEIQQFIDYTVRQYNPVDYAAAIKYYNTYAEMITAFNSNTGSEYDLAEDSFAKDHRIYRKMILLLTRQKGWSSMKDVLSLSEQDRQLLVMNLIRETGATENEIRKLLRL